jgi:hypothetical protein
MVVINQFRSVNAKKHESFSLFILCLILNIITDNVKKDYIYDLKPWQECAGELISVIHENNSTIISFTNKMQVRCYGLSEEILDKLKNSIGKTVNILKTDVFQKEYCIKIFENSLQHFSNSKSAKDTKKKILEFYFDKTTGKFNLREEEVDGEQL